MPFTEQSRRQPALDGTLKEPQPGDLCFVHYHKMKQAWKAIPRWMSVHVIYRTLLRDKIQLSEDSRVALDLAWQVFFALVVLPYEKKKPKENGDIK